MIRVVPRVQSFARVAEGEADARVGGLGVRGRVRAGREGARCGGEARRARVDAGGGTGRV